MNHRERVFAAINHTEPDRVPYNARLCPEIQNVMKSILPTGADHREIYQEDIYFVGVSFPAYENRTLDYLPLPTKEAVDKLKREVQDLKDKEVVVCNTYIPGVYEHVKDFLGDETALVGMYEEPEELKAVITKVANWLYQINEINATVGFDICWIGDDIGAQNALIMSPASYREFYKPHHRELVKRIKRINTQAKVAFHCCGHVMPLIPELLDIGVDILETVQPEAHNDLIRIKADYGDKMTFWGAIGMQSVFFDHTPAQVKEAVRQSLEIMSSGGGYIAAPCHTVTKEMKIENVIAFYETLQAYGVYPSPGRSACSQQSSATKTIHSGKYE